MLRTLFMCLYVLKMLFLKSTPRFATTFLIFSYVPVCGNVAILLTAVSKTAGKEVAAIKKVEI